MLYNFCFIILGNPQPDVDEDLAERMSAMRRPGESDMDYFERRYQERVSPLWIEYSVECDL